MALASPTGEILERLERAIERELHTRWRAEPPAARLALVIREELERWTREAYPASSCEGTALEKDSRRRLCLTIHSAPVTHRVEIWGLACGDPVEGPPPNIKDAVHSWVVLAHLGGPCPNLRAAAASILAAGLREVDRRVTPRLSLSLWVGGAAPEGCPDCEALPAGD